MGNGARTTTEAGLGWQHQQQRRRLVAALIDGTPCPYADTDPKCPGPMYRADAANLDADHYGKPRHYGGRVADRLAHASCNRRAGQRLGQQIRDGETSCDHHAQCHSNHSRPW